MMKGAFEYLRIHIFSPWLQKKGFHYMDHDDDVNNANVSRIVEWRFHSNHTQSDYILIKIVAISTYECIVYFKRPSFIQIKTLTVPLSFPTNTSYASYPIYLPKEYNQLLKSKCYTQLLNLFHVYTNGPSLTFIPNEIMSYIYTMLPVSFHL